MAHLNQMPIATKENKLDISSEKKLEEVAKQVKSNLKNGDINSLNMYRFNIFTYEYLCIDIIQ